jgi:O-antigen/teichoic acid export membrane protein
VTEVAAPTSPVPADASGGLAGEAPLAVAAVVAGADRDLRRSLFGAGCRSIQPILLNILSVPAMAYIIRKLGAADYGHWTTATSLVATTGVLTSLGLRGTFIRGVAQDPASAPAAFAEQLGTRILLSVLAIAVTMIACLSLGYPPVVVACTAIAAVGIALTCIWTTASDLFEASQRFPEVASIAMIAGLLLTAGSVIAVAVGAGPVWLSAAYLVGPAASIAIAFEMLRRERFPLHAHFCARQTVRLLWTSRHFTAQQLLTVVNANIAMLMLPKLVGAASFGLFSAGVLLITRLAIFPDSIGTAFYPLISKSIEKDRRLARRQSLVGIGVALAICVCVAVTTTLLAGFVSHILFPKAPAGCQKVIAITIWALPLMGVESLIGYGLNAAGRESVVARASVFSAVVSLAIGCALVIGWGVSGACWFMLLRPAVQIAFTLPIFGDAFSQRMVVEPAPNRQDSPDKGEVATAFVA